MLTINENPTALLHQHLRYKNLLHHLCFYHRLSLVPSFEPQRSGAQYHGTGLPLLFRRIRTVSVLEGDGVHRRHELMGELVPLVWTNQFEIQKRGVFANMRPKLDEKPDDFFNLAATADGQLGRDEFGLTPGGVVYMVCELA